MNSDGNFKMKCIGIKDIGCDYYTVGKIYEVTNGHWIDDEDDSMGSNSIKTIEDVNEWSDAIWELVEEETPKPVKEEKTLLEIVMERLGVEEGEKFNILWDGKALPSYNPFVFEDGELLNKYGNSDTETLGQLITGRCQFEKLPWKPKNGEKVWVVYLDENKNSWCNYSIFKDYTSSCIALYKMGWLFKTEEEAEANMKRVLREMKEVMENE